MNTFLNLGIEKHLLNAINDLGFETPSEIQQKTIPKLLSTECDLVALAQTGTGKTAAFGLPLLHLTDVNDKSIQSLILCPTRELCLQIGKDLSMYSKYLKGVSVLSVYGGEKIEKQIKNLKKTHR